MGAKEEGTRGFIKGLGLGVFGCIAATSTGAIVGSVQITRGLLNTPAALVSMSRGKIWRSADREWVENTYSIEEDKTKLEEEKKKLFPEEESGGSSEEGGESGDGTKKKEDTPEGQRSKTEKSSASRGKAKAKSTELYDLLDVGADSDAGTIRKAYYKKSLLCHPDKNPDDPEASEKFHTITEVGHVCWMICDVDMH